MNVARTKDNRLLDKFEFSAEEIGRMVDEAEKYNCGMFLLIYNFY